MSTDPHNTRVQRYDLSGGDGDSNRGYTDFCVGPVADGDYVRLTDYAALESQNARLRELVGVKDEALESAKLMIVHGDFKNGVTGEGGYPDEGEVRASEMLSRIQDAHDLTLDNIRTENK